MGLSEVQMQTRCKQVYCYLETASNPHHTSEKVTLLSFIVNNKQGLSNLFFHRFYYRGMWRDKITTHVDYPLENLNMSNYVAGPKTPSPYSLYAVSVRVHFLALMHTSYQLFLTESLWNAGRRTL
jgi:hypothetical protein